MTSTKRNSLHRRNHKERAQLVGRKKLGLLEKHKDYVLRAKDFHSKQDRIKRLKEKAAERNKDEFYFGMKKAKTIKGVHVQSRGNKALPTDMVKVLKTQDANYIRTVRNKGRKRIASLQAQLTSFADLIKPSSESDGDNLEESEMEILRQAGIISSASLKGKRRKESTSHVIFVEDEAKARNYVPNASPSLPSSLPVGTTQVDLGWAVPISSKKGKRVVTEDADELKAQEEIKDDERRVESKQVRSGLLKELAARLTRDTALRYTERELQMQTLMMGKGARRKIHGPELVQGQAESEGDEDEFSFGRKQPARTKEELVYKPRVFKWKQERKR